MATTDAYGQPRKGGAGIYSYYERNGQLIVRVRKNDTQHLPPTRARARQMTKFANLITAWRSLHGALKNCFENKKPGANDYSAFMAANLKAARVHLTHDMAEDQACVADNFVLSNGTMTPNIQVWESGEWMISDILVSPLGEHPDPSVAEFSRRIIGADPRRFDDDDELLFIRMSQVMDINNPDCPDVRTTVNRFTLEPDYNTPISMKFKQMGSDDGFLVVDGHLAARRMKDSLVAWIHRRKVRGRWTVTSQRLIGNNSLLEKYIDRQAIVDAVDSYSPAPVPFLSTYKETEPQALIDAVSNNTQLGTVEGSGNYSIGNQVVLKAIPAAGGRFVCWDDGWEEPEREVKVERDATFKAIFAPKR